MTPRRLLLALLLLLSAGGCAPERITQGEGCLYADCTPGDAAPRESCDPLDPTACSADEKCGHALPGDGSEELLPICTTHIGDQQVGDLCTTYAEGEDDCAPGLWCTFGRCRAYCGSDASCGDDQVCAMAFSEAGLCIDTCDPLDPTACDPGHNCGNFGEYMCWIAASRPNPGAECSSDASCAANFSCVGAVGPVSGTCEQRCDLSDPICPDGLTCESRGSAAHPDLGTCTAG